MGLIGRILRRVLSSVFLAVVVFVVAPVTAVVTVIAALIFLPLPATIPTARAVAIVEPTVIYDAQGHVMATLSQDQRDIPVTAQSIPAVLDEAVVADEDRNYYHEGGVDLRGILRAFVADVRNESIVQGGSTIAEQYVKLAYTDSSKRTIIDKVREAILASQLDRQASKNEILYRYLSTIYLGDGNYGVGAAARNYFHVPVSALNASQAATLAGLIPAPTARAPRQNLADAEQLRRLVLLKMYQQGYLTATAYHRALRRPLALAGHTHRRASRVTLVYPEPSPTTAYPAFVAYVTAWLLHHYPAAEVYGGGLRVQTTLDPKVQGAAQAAVDATLSGTADPLEMAVASVQPQTGFIVALVGHRSAVTPAYANDDFALAGCPPAPAPGRDVVAPSCRTHPSIGGGGAGRQPGSSWKPFVLAAAFGQHIPPTRVYEAPTVYQIPGCVVLAGQPATSCQIHNDEGEAPGSETLAAATAQSTNTVYAQVASQVGCADVARTARALGVTTAYYTPRSASPSSGRPPGFPYCASYALGELGVAPLDMASAYGVFADHGLRAPATPILQIVGPSGRTLVDNIKRPPATTRALATNVADNVTAALQGVITHGTGTAAALGRPAAGKTGTTSNTTDAWFVGYTPSLSTAVWMGNASSEALSIGPVKGVAQVYGGTLPAAAWRATMLRALADVPATGFDQPAPITPPQPAIRTGPTTPSTIGPGAISEPAPTPQGGPYQGQAPTPTPPAAASTTTVAAPTTTVAPTTTLGPGG